MKKMFVGLLASTLLGAANVVGACAHVDINDSSKAIIFDTFVQDIRDDNYIHMGDEIGLLAEMHIAPSDGSFCGAKRQWCGASVS